MKNALNTTSAAQVASGSQEIASGSQNLSQGSTEQETGIPQIDKGTEQVSAVVQASEMPQIELDQSEHNKYGEF